MRHFISSSLQLNALLLTALLFSALFISNQALAKQYLVDSQTAYKNIATKLQPGDTVVLKNGVWTDFEILFKGQGRKNAPISLTAQTKGKVILSGLSNLRLAGEYLHVSGLVFKNGYTPSGAVIEFRQNKKHLANHSRVSEVVIDNYNNPDKREPDYWVALHGKHNRFDHNHLVGKRNKGVTLAVRLNDVRSQQNHHQIDHNYFGYRPTFGSNGGETLRIGTSHFSLTDSFTKVENNYFEQTNGEVEIISVKSGNNIVRGNVFYEARGTLTMRHGNHNLIEENIFIGNGIEHTGGIRVINKHHIIRNNYLQGLTGYRFGSGFTIMNGVPNSPINRYHQVDDVLVENNSFINLTHIQLAAGSDAERSAVPINSKMHNNLIYNQNGQQPFTLFDDISGIDLAGNITNTQVLDELKTGIKQQNITLQQLANGLLTPNNSALNVGAKQNLKVLNKQDTGVTWYPKTPAVIAFDSGKTHTVKTADKLLSAINSAQSGDIIELESGQYDIAKLVKIDKTLTIKSASTKTTNKPLITFERSTLFEIHDGGSLKLDSLVISGQNSPDYSGNSVVRSKKWGMIDNYRFVMSNSEVKDLDVNHSFHFLVTGKVAFADEITLINNTFSNISGDLLRLNTEVEDLGVYNAEYVNLKDNTIENIKGAVVKLYRGGSDESTFGPHLLMSNNQLNNVGLGKRNKNQASLYLHGVQVTKITNNKILNSAPIMVEHTVGEPQTLIANNKFNATKGPSVKELRVKGPHTAVIRNNHAE